MKRITADSLGKARHCLKNAKKALAAEMDDIAAREAYMAAFNAVQALIFERRDTVPRTHRGTHSLFAEIIFGEEPAARGLSAFLAHAYKYKTIADYTHAHTVTREEASQVIDMAEALTVEVAELVNRSVKS